MNPGMAVFTEKFNLVQHYTERIFADHGRNLGYPFMGRIEQLTKEMLAIYNSQKEENRRDLLNMIVDTDCPFLNRAKFALVPGIAFCHNFSPTINTSAYVATRRLKQIDTIYGQPVAWHCFRANMHTRPNDPVFHAFYGKLQCKQITTIGSKTYWDEKLQYEWGQMAFNAAMKLPAKVIYSRSMWVGSHIAAWFYKQKYPDAYWYAEFSDLHYITTENTLRSCNYNNLGPFKGNFYCVFEKVIMESADYLIFTNKNQKDFMIDNNPELRCKSDIRKKSHAIIHPPVDKRYRHLSELQLNLDDNYIHIAYFGSVYKERNLDTMFDLLDKYEKIKLYLYLINKKYLNPPEHLLERISVSDAICNFDFHHVASQFDFLYLEDIYFPCSVNPFLPSKFVEYLSTDVKILLKSCDNSTIAKCKSFRIVNLNDFAPVYNEICAREFTSAQKNNCAVEAAV